MNTKSVPALVTLLAGFIACVAGIRAHMEVADFLIMLLIVLIVFYFLGGVVRMILDMNFETKQEEETTDGEALQTDDGESAVDGGDADEDAGEE
jgi:uncharacterized protein HemY